VIITIKNPISIIKTKRRVKAATKLTSSIQGLLDTECGFTALSNLVEKKRPKYTDWNNWA
jgi:hypothetical protein